MHPRWYHSIQILHR